jgi:hypothetical protein
MQIVLRRLNRIPFPVLLVLACCLPARPQSCVVAPSGLVSWWTGDTNEKDIVGGNSPEAVNAVTLVAGEVKDGFTFGTDGYIEIAPSSSLANPQFTWAAWVKPAGPGPNNDSYGSVIVEQIIDDSDAAVDLLWSAATEHFLFFSGNESVDLITSKDTFAAGGFYFVAATYDGSTFQLFVNGVLEGSLSESKTVSYPSNPWMIGSTQPSFISQGYARTFNGIIDEVQAYSVALSQSQIQAIYNAGAAGVCKGLTFLPTYLKFARQTVGATSPPLTATVTNAFPLPEAIENVGIKGDFAETNTCPASPATLAPGADCSLSVTFTPTSTGTRTGWVAFIYNHHSIQQIFGLTGAATDVGLSTAVLKFSHQVVGTTSIAQTVTVTNVGTSAVNFTGSGIVIAGADPADFVISGNTCGPSLAGDSECTISVVFAPTADGPRNATLQFNDDSGASPQTVVLTGAATDVSPSATLLNFHSHAVGTTSAAHTVTVTNVGTATINFTGSGIVIAGTDPADFAIPANTCGATLAAGAECEVSVKFKPSATGTRTALLEFNDDGGASPQYVELYGSGT